MTEQALDTVSKNVQKIIGELPAGIKLVAAAKAAPGEAVIEAIGAGVSIIGENYVQEAEQHQRVAGGKAAWHFIGHLQKNKARKAAAIFDMIETVDSVEIAREIDRQCARLGKVMPVLIEVNSGRERRKAGIHPEYVADLAADISACYNLRLEGLMTIGPPCRDAEELRPYFAETRRIFDSLKRLPGIEMRYLSMGMTASYRIAIEEGANIIRVGTGIFGQRR